MHQQQQRYKHAILFRSDFGKSWRSGHKAHPGVLQMGTYVPTNENSAIKPGGVWYRLLYINPLTPNDPYSGRTAPLTSKRCILCLFNKYK